MESLRVTKECQVFFSDAYLTPSYLKKGKNGCMGVERMFQKRKISGDRLCSGTQERFLVLKSCFLCWMRNTKGFTYVPTKI